MEDKDEHCRLRHGLNAHCLAHIFQYLDSVDLYTVGRMNEAYHQIISDFVIPKHEVCLDSSLFRCGISILHMFETYGRHIRKISLHGSDLNQTTEQLLQSITQFCAPDQLKSVKIIRRRRNREFLHVNLPHPFRKVEIFDLRGFAEWQISVRLSEMLRVLTLVDTDLDPDFDWIRLKNLKKLHLRRVNGINVRHFVDLLDMRRPNLEYFHHGELDQLLNGTIQDVCDAIALYCGNQIQYYSGEMPPPPRDGSRTFMRHPYDFISSFINVKEVSLTSYELCGGDIIDAIKQLSENDTIEALNVRFYDWIGNCTFRERSNDNSYEMKNFSHLKTIKMYASNNVYNNSEVCHPLNLFSVYSSQILSNVENLSIESTEGNLKFLEFATNLRYLELFIDRFELDHAIKIQSTLESIVQKRSNAQSGKQNGDFIEIKFHHIHDFELFCGIEGRSDSVKLALLALLD